MTDTSGDLVRARHGDPLAGQAGARLERDREMCLAGARRAQQDDAA